MLKVISMSKDWISKHPRFTYLMVGLLFGTAIAVFVSKQSDKTVREYKEINERIIEEYSTKTEEQTATIETLRTENRKLKQKSSTYKIVHPDGTVEERTASETESETSISESVKEQYQRMVVEETGKVHKYYSEKIEKLTREKRKLNVSSGLTTKLDWTVEGNYSVWGPYTVGGGLINPHQTPSYLFTIGVNL